MVGILVVARCLLRWFVERYWLAWEDLSSYAWKGLFPQSMHHLWPYFADFVKAVLEQVVAAMEARPAVVAVFVDVDVDQVVPATGALVD